jgi:multicomponent Na+:H+ antiporter subunit F
VSLADTILFHAANVSLVALCIAFLATVYRVIAGPTLPDRVLALDMLVAIAIGFIAVYAVQTGISLYIDIAIALGLVGFLSTVAFARYVLQEAQARHNAGNEPSKKSNAGDQIHVE